MPKTLYGDIWKKVKQKQQDCFLLKQLYFWNLIAAKSYGRDKLHESPPCGNDITVRNARGIGRVAAVRAATSGGAFKGGL
jgi:hypothetical protein